jgi:magnesium-transporting ATPase (P-type)
MEEKFQLLKVRPFTEVINDAIAFARRYIRQFGYVILVLVVPIYIIGAFLYSSSISSAFDLGRSASLFNIKRFAAGSLFGAVVLMIGRLLLSVIFMSTFLLVENSENGEVDAKDIMSGVKTYLGRLMGLYFLIIIVAGVIGGICAMVGMALSSVSAIGILVLLGIVAFIAIVYVAIPFSFVPIIYVREGLGFGESFSRAFFLVKDNWWWTFLILMVAGLIGAMGAYIFSLPYVVLTMMKTFTSIRGGHTGYDVSLADRLALTLSQFGGIITASVATIACYIQYYSLVEKKDGLDLMSQIENIGADENPTN